MKKFLAISMTMCGLMACTSAPHSNAEYAPLDRALLDSVDAIDGVQATASGLRYQMIIPGQGPQPAPTDTILVGYRGLHADGSLFWEDEGEEFCLGGTIKGFQEGVGMMSVGAKYMLYIPSTLGYGSKGIPNLIEPDEPLVYEVTLKGFRHPQSK